MGLYSRYGIVGPSTRRYYNYRFIQAPNPSSADELWPAIKLLLVVLGAPVFLVGVLVAIGSTIKTPPAPVIPPPTQEQVRAQILHRLAINGDRRWYENDIIETVDENLRLSPGPDSECLRSDEAGNVSEVSYSLCEAASATGKQRLSLD